MENIQRSRVRNDLFIRKKGLNRGKSFPIEACWYFIKILFFQSSFPWPSGLKRILLIIFGAKIGKSVCLKPRINILFPWKLTIGDHSWIGEEVIILNFEKIKIGNHVCISQRAFLCAGNHDFRDPSMTYKNAPIEIQDGAWVCAQVFVSPGITIHTDAVVRVSSVVLNNLDAGMIYAGNPCTVIGQRWH